MGAEVWKIKLLSDINIKNIKVCDDFDDAYIYAISKISGIEAEVIGLVYEKGLSYKQIAKRLGVCVEYVRKIHITALNKLSSPELLDVLHNGLGENQKTLS